MAESTLKNTGSSYTFDLIWLLSRIIFFSQDVLFRRHNIRQMPLGALTLSQSCVIWLWHSCVHYFHPDNHKIHDIVGVDNCWAEEEMVA